MPGTHARFAICLKGNEGSLLQGKVYVVIRDNDEKHGMVRVVDETGEDYLFSEDRFLLIDLPAKSARQVEEAIGRS